MSDLFGGEPIRSVELQAGRNLQVAKIVKDDEFYTLEVDIEKEIAMFESHFRGKIVYCNCDSERSNFPKWFRANQERLGIRDVWNHGGPFQSAESIDMLRRCDIVVTNPPFAPFTEYVRQLRGYDKDFLIIGSVMKAGCRAMFELIQAGRARIGYHRPKKFKRPDGSISTVGCNWYTTLPVEREPLVLEETYDPARYPRYDMYPEFIEVDRTKRIPSDYDGLMGVPITFLEKHDPRQFDVLDALESWGGYSCKGVAVNGVALGLRIIIKHVWSNAEAPKRIPPMVDLGL